MRFLLSVSYIICVKNDFLAGIRLSGFQLDAFAVNNMSSCYEINYNKYGLNECFYNVIIILRIINFIVCIIQFI